MGHELRVSMVFLFLLAPVSMPTWAFGQGDSINDTLSGVLTTDVGPGVRAFVVVGNLYIPPGTTVSISPGTVFLFENFAGLHIQGTLLARGTENKPIIFTSTNDHEWNPAASVDAAPFDWNGIDMDEAAIGTELSECVIRYSVYGIRAQTEHFRLKNVSFNYNGKADLTIKGEQRKINEQPYSCGLQKPAPVIVSPVTNKSTRFRMTIRYTGLTLALAGCAAGSWALSAYPQAQKNFDKINTRDNGGALLYTSAEWDAAKQTRDRDLAALLLGWGGALIGVTGFVATFTF